jgi:hypothetical protein
VECVKILAQSSNCNSNAGCFLKTFGQEALNHFVFFGERHLRYVVREFRRMAMPSGFTRGWAGG